MQALIPLVNVPLLSYVLESLNRNGIEEVFVFCATFVDKIKEFIRYVILKKNYEIFYLSIIFRKGIEDNLTWSVGMAINVIPSEGVSCFGDALRELDNKHLLKNNFVLMNADTITNANLLPSVMRIHRENCKRDKITAMTVIYKKVAPGQRTGNEVMIATDKSNNRLLYHQRLNPAIKEVKFEFPIEIFLAQREVELHHDLMDPQISICSINALPLFSDNFDFETRDQFINGIMNEEIPSATIYVAQLSNEEYASKVSDWRSYHMVSGDVINRWVYPLVPDMGVCLMSQQYLFFRGNIYRHKNIKVERDCSLLNDVVLYEGCSIGGKTILSSSVCGKNCQVGKNCKITNAYLFDGVTIDDNCTLENCIIANGVQIKEGCKIFGGAVISDNCVFEKNSSIDGLLVQSSLPRGDFTVEFEKLGVFAYSLKDDEEEQQLNNSEEDIVNALDIKPRFVRMIPHEVQYESSAYSSCESDGESDEPAFIQEDSSIFLSEVIESLKRGFDEKSNPDFLILEINSSRYAYNMALNEVNFFVIKAVLSLPIVQESSDQFDGFKKVYEYLGENVVKNYIKGESAMHDCLNAIVETCEEIPAMKPKLAKIIHFLYDEDVISEEVILTWFEDLGDDKDWVSNSLKKLVEWLQQDSEEDSSEE